MTTRIGMLAVTLVFALMANRTMAALNLYPVPGNGAGPSVAAPGGIGPIPGSDRVDDRPWLTIMRKTETSMTFNWRDHTRNEMGNRLYQTEWGQDEVFLRELGPLASLGTFSVEGLTPKTYYCHRIETYNAAGVNSSPERCAHTLPAPPDAILDEDLDRITSLGASYMAYNRGELVVALKDAREGDVVYVHDSARIDLTGTSLTVPAGVSLASGRGLNDSRGAWLYTRDKKTKRLISIGGPNVRITGLRIHGPELGIGEGRSNTSRGISSRSFVGIEIDHNELSGWSGAAIDIRDAAGVLSFVNPEAVYIHDNYIHHNQHEGTQGYGVVIGDGAYVLIERNVFDFNRHAIAGDGSDGSGYWAYENLVLKGGGIHRCVSGVCVYTHQFDMHGQENCGVFDLFSDSLYNCGRAGHSIEIRYNTFQYTKDNAFKLRGTPSVSPTGAYIAFNVFAHDNMSDAVAQTESGLYLGKNRVGVDAFGKYGVCDFNGDGKDDLFLATGSTWWYSSAGQRPWTYLNTSSKRLHQVALGYFDDDNRCDVFATVNEEFAISKAGTSAWQPLKASRVAFGRLRFGDFNGDGHTDVFRSSRGKWYVSWGGTSGWQRLNTSGFGVASLRFGDFNGDGHTDVFRSSRGKWYASWSGTSGWQRLSGADWSLSQIIIGDFSGDGREDVAGRKSRRLYVSPGGESAPYRLNSDFLL